jgi:hypothetical protein
MARWSDTMKLKDYEEWQSFLDGYSGCYQIGYYYRGEFKPKYIGRGENIWNRIKTYMNPKRCHNDRIEAKLYAERHNLWFRYLRTLRYQGLEARQQARHGVLKGGLYEWNKRIEWSWLEA